MACLESCREFLECERLVIGLCVVRVEVYVSFFSRCFVVLEVGGVIGGGRVVGEGVG